MKERQRYQLPVECHVEPDDFLICTVQDRKTKTAHEFCEKIGRTMLIDTCVTFDVDDPVLGLESGVGAIFERQIQ